MLLAAMDNEGLKEVPAAIDAYRRACNWDPKNPIAQYNLAYLLLTSKGDLTTQARRLAEQAVAAAPRNGEIYARWRVSTRRSASVTCDRELLQGAATCSPTTPRRCF